MLTPTPVDDFGDVVPQYIGRDQWVYLERQCSLEKQSERWYVQQSIKNYLQAN